MPVIAACSVHPVLPPLCIGVNLGVRVVRLITDEVCEEAVDHSFLAVGALFIRKDDGLASLDDCLDKWGTIRGQRWFNEERKVVESHDD